MTSSISFRMWTLSSMLSVASVRVGFFASAVMVSTLSLGPKVCGGKSKYTSNSRMSARVIVAVAGMEGALPSVVAGLTDCPVIGVPTSVGYGMGAGGQAALLAMLNSCATGLTVVNIDNGFGAGFAAALVNQGTSGRRTGRG